MALPLTNTRSIVIDGEDCRWVISRTATTPGAKLLVQGSGGLLSIDLQEEIEGMVWLCDADGRSVVGPMTPNWVRRLSKMAMEKGWSPREGMSLHLTMGASGLEIFNKDGGS